MTSATATAGPAPTPDIPTPDATAVAVPADVEPAGPRTLGVYLGLNNDLLLRFEERDNAWVRLPTRSTFVGGARLLVLPTFRTLAVLGADVNAFVGGGTEITMRAPETNVASDIAFELPYGRVILNSGQNGNRVALIMGDQTRVIKLAKSSSLAVEVRRTFVPGGDPTRDLAPMEVSWYLTTGDAEWTVEGANPATQSAKGPATWSTIAGIDSTPQTISDLPTWVDKEPTTDNEARARDDVAKTLVAGQPVKVSLLELTGTTGLGRRTEVRCARGAERGLRRRV